MKQESGGGAGGLKRPTDGQTDSAVTHKVESTTNSTGGCSVSYFMDECTVGFGDHAAAAACHRLPPGSGPRVTGEPLRHPPRPAQNLERTPPPHGAVLLVWPTGEMPHQPLCCPRSGRAGHRHLLQLREAPSGGPAAWTDTRTKKRRERRGGGGECGVVSGTPN